MDNLQQGIGQYYDLKNPISDEKPLTRAEVQTVINDLVNVIKIGFATRSDLDSFVNRLSNNINTVERRIPSRDAIINTAKEAVPVCLRNLDSGGAQRTGPVLTLAPSPDGVANNADSCAFVPWQPTLPPPGTVNQVLTLNALLKAVWADATGTGDADWVFKFVSSVNTVATFNGGPVVRGTNLIGIMSSFTPTISATGDIVYVVYTMSSGALSYGVANAANFPVSGSGTYVKALQSFTLTGSTITPLLTYHRGVIQIDGCYS